MAKIKKGIITVACDSKEYEDTAEQFFDDFKEILDEAGIEYEYEYIQSGEGDCFWLFNKKISITFRCFRQKIQTEKEGLVAENVYLALSTSWPELFRGIVSTGNDTVYYEIALSSFGDIMLRMSCNGNLKNNKNVVFVICRTNNIVDPTLSEIGIYAPLIKGNEDDYTQNCTPKFLVTNDTDISNPIINNVASETMSGTLLNYIINSNAPITALVPICAVSSQCVSINTKIMAIAPAPITGYATLNGQRYYCVGMVCMADDEE